MTNCETLTTSHRNISKQNRTKENVAIVVANDFNLPVLNLSKEYTNIIPENMAYEISVLSGISRRSIRRGIYLNNNLEKIRVSLGVSRLKNLRYTRRTTIKDLGGESGTEVTEEKTIDEKLAMIKEWLEENENNKDFERCVIVID